MVKEAVGFHSGAFRDISTKRGDVLLMFYSLVLLRDGTEWK